MTTAAFDTDAFRDQTFDLLSGIANDPTKFDEFNDAYVTKIQQRADVDQLRKYTRELYEKILCKTTELATFRSMTVDI